MSRHSPPRARARTALPSVVVGLLFLTSACGVRPKPLTLHDHIARADADRAAVEAHYVPVAYPHLKLPTTLPVYSEV